jgi:hypothetical protein
MFLLDLLFQVFVFVITGLLAAPIEALSQMLASGPM